MFPGLASEDTFTLTAPVRGLVLPTGRARAEEEEEEEEEEEGGVVVEEEENFATFWLILTQCHMIVPRGIFQCCPLLAPFDRAPRLCPTWTKVSGGTFHFCLSGMRDVACTGETLLSVNQCVREGH